VAIILFDPYRWSFPGTVLTCCASGSTRSSSVYSS